MLYGVALPIGSRFPDHSCGPRHTLSCHVPPILYPTGGFCSSGFHSCPSWRTWSTLVSLISTVTWRCNPSRRQSRHTLYFLIFAGLWLGALARTWKRFFFRRVTTPRLEELEIDFFKRVTFSVLWLLQFMNTTKNFRFDRAKFEF